MHVNAAIDSQMDDIKGATRPEDSILGMRSARVKMGQGEKEAYLICIKCCAMITHHYMCLHT